MVRDTVQVISATEFQRNIGEKVNEVSNHKVVTIVQSHGRDQVALLPVERYRELTVKEREADTARMLRLIAVSSDQDTKIDNSN